MKEVYGISTSNSGYEGIGHIIEDIGLFKNESDAINKCAELNKEHKCYGSYTDAPKNIDGTYVYSYVYRKIKIV